MMSVPAGSIPNSSPEKEFLASCQLRKMAHLSVHAATGPTGSCVTARPDHINHEEEGHDESALVRRCNTVSVRTEYPPLTRFQRGLSLAAVDRLNWMDSVEGHLSGKRSVH